jgi:hypothetical protein
MAWQSLKKSINGFINKVNVPNMQSIVVELLGVNLVRGRGLFARACMKVRTAAGATVSLPSPPLRPRKQWQTPFPHTLVFMGLFSYCRRKRPRPPLPTSMRRSLP